MEPDMNNTDIEANPPPSSKGGVWELANALQYSLELSWKQQAPGAALPALLCLSRLFDCEERLKHRYLGLPSSQPQAGLVRSVVLWLVPAAAPEATAKSIHAAVAAVDLVSKMGAYSSTMLTDILAEDTAKNLLAIVAATGAVAVEDRLREDAAEAMNNLVRAHQSPWHLANLLRVKAPGGGNVYAPVPQLVEVLQCVLKLLRKDLRRHGNLRLFTKIEKAAPKIMRTYPDQKELSQTLADIQALGDEYLGAQGLDSRALDSSGSQR